MIDIAELGFDHGEVLVVPQAWPENIVRRSTAKAPSSGTKRRWRTIGELLDRIKEVAVLEPQPEVHVRGDRNTGFEFIGRVTVTCQRDGIQKVAFITEPVSGAAQQE